MRGRSAGVLVAACLAACSGSAPTAASGVRSGGAAIPSRTDRHYSDLHNSVGRRLLAAGGPEALRDERWPVNLRDLEDQGAEAIVFSVGSVRFEMREENAFDFDALIARATAFKARAASELPEIAFAGDAAGSASGRSILWVFGLEGSHVLAGHLDRLPELGRAGFRIIGVGHEFQDEFVDAPASPTRAATGEPRRTDEGSELTALGRELVEAAIAAGLVIDVSHLRRRAFWQVVEIDRGRGPLIASHSNARALLDDPRNLDDEQARAIAGTGGLVGVTFHAPLLAADPEAAGARDVAAHLRHWVDTIGLEHVALGTDLEGRIRPAGGLHRVSDLATLDEALSCRGFEEAEIYAMKSGNVRRFLERLSVGE